MEPTFNPFMFALDRVRTVILVLAMIVLLKAAWIIIVPF
jgi:hypothetical protein